MTTKNANPEVELDTPSTDETEEPESLYDTELTSFRTAIEKNLEGGLKQCGFALIHSLDSAERVLVFDKLGLPCKDAVDFYNLGTAHAANEDYEKAIDYWKKSLKIDPEHKETLFNLAVVYEKLDDMAKARKYYDQYLVDLEDPEEIEMVNNHLAELAN